MLLGIGSILLINQINTNNTENNTATQQEDAEQNDKRQEKQKNEKKDNEKGENKGDELNKDSPPQRLKERVVEAVQGTVDIFTKEETRIVAVGDSLTQGVRSEEHTSELQSRGHLVCRLLLEKKNTLQKTENTTN